MIFKQGILREEKIKFATVIVCTFIPLFILIAMIFIKNDDVKLSIFFIMVCYLPILSLILIFDLKNLEWHYIYNDRIETTGVFGIKNTVYYKNVLFVEEVDIKLTSRGENKKFYIFNDGRKNNNNILGINSCYNEKKYNLRMNKTPELESFVVNFLKLKTVKTGDGSKPLKK